MAYKSGQGRYILRFISGKYQGGEFALEMNQELIIGRSSELEMVLIEDMVSRHHAKITTTNDEITIEDLGSTNGTFVNGEKTALKVTYDAVEKLEAAVQAQGGRPHFDWNVDNQAGV